MWTGCGRTAPGLYGVHLTRATWRSCAPCYPLGRWWTLITTGTGTSSLYVASNGGHVEVVRALLSAGAQVDLVTPGYGASPLWVASDWGDVEVVHALLPAGARVDLAMHDLHARPTTVGGIRHRHLAALGGIPVWPPGGRARPAVGRCSGGHGQDAWRSLAASQHGHVEVARALLSAGAQVDLIGSDQTSTLWADHTSPLWVASAGGHLEVVRALLSAGAQVDLVSGRWNCSTPLWRACKHGHAEVALELLSSGAQLCLPGQEGRSALDVCSSELRARLAQALDQHRRSEQCERQGRRLQLEGLRLQLEREQGEMQGLRLQLEQEQGETQGLRLQLEQEQGRNRG